MPSKKSSQNHGTNEKSSHRPSSPLFKENGDPLETVISVFEKKGRNLSKRKERLSALQKEREGGKEFDKDQLEAISKLPDVLVQIEFLHEMQKQFAELHTEYQRHLKTKQKREEKIKMEEKQAQKSSLAYCFRVQLMLEQLDDETKESFRNGSDGAVQLTDSELKQVDDFYNLVHPQRPGNASFDQELASAAQHMILLQEEAGSKVAGTTYKSLHKVFDKIDSCGYLNTEHVIPDEETQEEEEEVEVELDTNQVNDYTSLEEVSSNVLDDPPSSFHQQTIEIIQEEKVQQTAPTESPLIGTTFGDTPLTTEPVHQPTHLTTTAPSPDFAGLGSNNMTSMDFQFMRGDPQPSPVQTNNTPSSFPSTFTNNIQDIEPNDNTTTTTTIPSQPDVPYVPETGQQMNEKSDLVGTPVVGGSTDKTVDHNNNTTSYKSQGNGRQYNTSYDNRRSYQRSNNGNNRQRPYNKSRGNYGDSRGNYGDSRGNYGDSRGRDGNYSDSRRDGGYGGDSRRDGGNYGDRSNRMDGGRSRGGRGRSNYPYSRPQQNRSGNNNGSRTINNNNNATTTINTNTGSTRPQQPSYASTAAAQS